MSTVKVLILRAPGTNCDNETTFAFQQAGAVTELHHINRLIDKTVRLSGFQVLAVPGGFSYGDDIAAGKIQANEMKARLDDDIKRFIESGGLILGICNGFQVLAKTGYLSVPSSPGEQSFTLTNNDSGRFECRWIHMIADRKSNCVFTRGIDRLYLPVAHGEGKLVAEAKVLY
jgi:phosphoribosylformylglycinamidine (FGAM) synthase-like amidotransferase family enzyme